MGCDVDIRKDLYANIVLSGVLLCSRELVTVCSKKLLHSHQHQSKLRLLHHKRGSILFGLVDPFLHLCLLSKVCGSVRKSMTNQVLLLFTVNASNYHESPDYEEYLLRCIRNLLSIAFI